ncbi:hypothetical protein [Aulosira sp. FACHB-615]|uniref:hypothetical protein n=1 Tax=Aulosira sp. FACHB-615 TaxID=2692777 RepID=UPI0016864906|nr:hypothetical protein [Aulosira sp. FACHB-615]MBD2492524.1 hypothetical protein [Aulosira sp. FACHB-615]
MENHSSAHSEHRVLVIPLAEDNSRSLTPVRILHAHISNTQKIDKFIRNIGRFVGTEQSEFSDDWQMESYKILPTPTDDYSGVVLVYYKFQGVREEIETVDDLVLV